MKNKLIVFFLIFLVLETVLYYAAERVRDIAVNNNYSSELNSVSQAYEASITTSRNISDVLFNVMINNEEILSRFAMAEKADEQERNNIRKSMQIKLQNLYEQEKRIGLKQLHFHLRDCSSFLRMHEPERHGDSLLGVRYGVEIANKTQKFTEGFEEGRVYNGFRFVYPLFYQMKHIGSVEMGISSDFIVRNMDTLDKGIHDFIIKRSVVDDVVFPSEQYHYSSSGISDSYLRENISYATLADTRGIFDNTEELFNAYRLLEISAKDKLTDSKPFGLHIHVNNKEISAVFLPIYNIQGQHVAFFIKVYNDEKYHTINKFFQLLFVTLTLVMFFFLSFIYIVLSNNHKSRMLNAMLDEKLKEHEAQLEMKEQMLFQQSKLATLGEMFSALAHQWKQPLNILAMYVQNMLDDEMDEEETQRAEEIVDKCMTQINYMSETINDFMDFIRPAGNLSTRMEMIKAVEDILKLLNPSLQKKKIDVSVDTKGNKAVYAFGNSNEIKHILVNILNNAKDAIMEIKEKDRMFEGSIKIEIDTSGGFCCVNISDNGGGISKEIMSKIFEPYITTKKDKDGSGLGLYMCRTIIEKHNGTLNVINIENGARFEIKIPSADEQIK